MSSNKNEAVLVNAFSPSMIPAKKFVAEFERIGIEELRQYEIVGNYVRHPATVELISRVLQRPLTPNSGIYRFNGETIIVIMLAIPQRGQEVSQLTEEDLAIYRVRITIEE